MLTLNLPTPGFLGTRVVCGNSYTCSCSRTGAEELGVVGTREVWMVRGDEGKRIGYLVLHY